MKHPSVVHGIRGKVGKCYNGSWHRRMNVAMHLLNYHFRYPQWGHAQLTDFAYVARYNAWLRELEVQRKNV